MAIPMHTTTISVLRVPTAPTTDPYDAQPAATVIASGVRAHISSGPSREQVAGGQQFVTEPRLACDPIDLRHTDQIRDERTGDVYEVQTVAQRQGVMGLDHTAATLKRVEGLV